MQHVPANQCSTFLQTALQLQLMPQVTLWSATSRTSWSLECPSPEPTRPSHTLVASHRQPQEYPGPAAQWRPGSRRDTRDTLRAPRSQQLIFFAVELLSTAVFFCSQQLCFFALNSCVFRYQQLPVFALNSCAFSLSTAVLFWLLTAPCVFALNSRAYSLSTAVLFRPQKPCFLALDACVFFALNSAQGRDSYYPGWPSKNWHDPAGRPGPAATISWAGNPSRAGRPGQRQRPVGCSTTP